MFAKIRIILITPTCICPVRLPDDGDLLGGDALGSVDAEDIGADGPAADIEGGGERRRGQAQVVDLLAGEVVGLHAAQAEMMSVSHTMMVSPMRMVSPATTVVSHT